MNDKISKKAVIKTASLAKLDLTSTEVDKFGSQLASVLDNFSSVDEIKTENVEITAQVTGMKDVLVKDESAMKIDLSRKELLKNSPEQEDGFIIVPRVL